MFIPDATVTLVCDRIEHRWAFETSGFPAMSRRGCGHLLSATKHSLLAFALISALKSISPGSVQRHLVKTAEHATFAEARRHGRRLRVQIQTHDVALYRFLNNPELGGTKIAANLLETLQKELKRFACQYRLCGEEDTHRTHVWSSRVLPSVTFPDGFPAPKQIAF